SPVADLVLTQTSSPATATAGTNLTYTLTLTNNGPDDALNVALSESLPAGTTFVSDTQSSGLPFNQDDPAVGKNGTINDRVGKLASGASARFIVVVAVPATTPENTT